jgi:hypothetical protein
MKLYPKMISVYRWEYFEFVYFASSDIKYDKGQMYAPLENKGTSGNRNSIGLAGTLWQSLYQIKANSLAHLDDYKQKSPI